MFRFEVQFAESKQGSRRHPLPAMFSWWGLRDKIEAVDVEATSAYVAFCGHMPPFEWRTEAWVDRGRIRFVWSCPTGAHGDRTVREDGDALVKRVDERRARATSYAGTETRRLIQQLHSAKRGWLEPWMYTSVHGDPEWQYLAMKAELSSRPHIPSKQEGRRLRREAARRAA